jgi:hypothetical protein
MTTVDYQWREGKLLGEIIRLQGDVESHEPRP